MKKYILILFLFLPMVSSAQTSREETLIRLINLLQQEIIFLQQNQIATVSVQSPATTTPENLDLDYQKCLQHNVGKTHRMQSPCEWMSPQNRLSPTRR